jgi:hypothetical protein
MADFSMFTLESITAAICTHWRDASPADVATAYPGASLGTEQLAEWYELDIDEVKNLRRRDAEPEEATAVLRLRCFARPGVATARVLQLAESARVAFSEQDVPISNPGNSDEVVVGWIRFNEGMLRDDSRDNRDRRRPPLRHVEWTWTGSVWACYAVSLTSSEASDDESWWSSDW